MPIIYLHFVDREENSARVSFHTGAILTSAEYTTLLGQIVPLIEAISDAVFTHSTMLLSYPEDNPDISVGEGIAERLGLLLAIDSEGNYQNISIPAAKEDIWQEVGVMAGVVASGDIAQQMIDILTSAGAMSDYNYPLQTNHYGIVNAK